MKTSTKQSLIWGTVLVLGIAALVVIGLYTGAVDPSAAS
jgi:hypothetical protein